MSEPLVAPLPGGASLYVWPFGQYIETRWPDGRTCGATREDAPENRHQAVEQGYADTRDGLWWSLLEHEALHTIVGAALWPDHQSAPLRHEGGDYRPYWMRLHEEAVVLALQICLNTGRIEEPLRAYSRHLLKWRDDLMTTLAALDMDRAA